MRCPTCEQDGDRVVDSRSIREGAAIRRRRECLSCSHRFTTYESVERAPVLVVKKDGRRVPYDRERLLTGVMLACQKRPISREAIDQVVGRVEARALGGAQGEIKSRALGEAVMMELEELDEIAYVRFASVYRSFRNVNQFMDELKTLLERQPPDGTRAEEARGS